MFILSKESKIYRSLPFYQKIELNSGITQSMSLASYQECLEEVWGKESTIPKEQIERCKALKIYSILFSVCEHY